MNRLMDEKGCAQVIVNGKQDLEIQLKKTIHNTIEEFKDKYGISVSEISVQFHDITDYIEGKTTGNYIVSNINVVLALDVMK